jgi:hypothetical protein
MLQTYLLDMNPRSSEGGASPGRSPASGLAAEALAAPFSTDSLVAQQAQHGAGAWGLRSGPPALSEPGSEGEDEGGGELPAGAEPRKATSGGEWAMEQTFSGGVAETPARGAQGGQGPVAEGVVSPAESGEGTEEEPPYSADFAAALRASGSPDAPAQLLA